MAGSYRKRASGRIELRFTDPTGKQRSGGTYATKQLAERAYARIVHSIETGTYEQELAVKQGDLDPKRVTLSELAAHWRSVRVRKDGQLLSPRTYDEYERIVEVTLAEFKDEPIAQISTQQLEKWLAKKRQAAPSMAVHAYKHLDTLMTYALKNRYIRRNPCDIEGATSYRPEKEREVPSRSQVEALIEHAEGQFKFMVALAAASGLRRGELLELRRRDISEFEENGEVWIQVSVSRAVIQRKKEHIVKVPKTRSSIRTVILPLSINDQVRKYMRGIPNISPDALLFATDPEHVQHWNESRVRSKWEHLRPMAGFEGTFHSLRAFAATQFGLTGATSREIMERFGHANLEVAARYQRTTGRETQLLKALR